MSLFRLLTVVYPAEFRRRYGEELEASFRAIRDEQRHAGALGRLRFWAFVITDLFQTGARLRWRQFSTRSRPLFPAQIEDRNGHDHSGRLVRASSVRQETGFAAIAVLSLGLAIGANSLIYGLVQGFVLRPFLTPIPITSWPSASGFPGSRTRGATSRCCRQPNTRTSRACAPSDRSRRSIWATATSPVATFRSACSRHYCSTICFPSSAWRRSSDADSRVKSSCPAGRR